MSGSATSAMEATSSYRTLGLAGWSPISLFTLAACVALLLSDFPAQGPALPLLALQLITGVAVTHFLSRRLATKKLALVLGTFIQASTIASASLILTYCAATTGRPLVDADLLQLDRLIGYDWKTYAHFFANHPWMATATVLAYNTNILQPALIIVVLVLSNEERRLEKFILTLLLTLIITTAIFSIYPVTTAWTYEWHTPDQLREYRYLMPGTEGWVRELLAIRGGWRPPAHEFWQGLVGFPSFHCVSALLYIWALWPVRWLRGLLVPLNLLMIAATLLTGGHYLADLIGGAIVTAVGIWVVNRGYDRWVQSLPLHPKRQKAGQALTVGSPLRIV